MGFFETLGRRVGEITHKYSGDSTYGCRSCGERFDTNYETCPQCGSDEVARVE